MFECSWGFELAWMSLRCRFQSDELFVFGRNVGRGLIYKFNCSVEIMKRTPFFFISIFVLILVVYVYFVSRLVEFFWVSFNMFFFHPISGKIACDHKRRPDQKPSKEYCANIRTFSHDDHDDHDDHNNNNATRKYSRYLKSDGRWR